MKPGNWNAGILSTACVVLGLILGLVLGGLFAPPVADEPWLKTYQGLVGALLGLSAAGLGLAVATKNVLRQLRVNLMSREEDRMERDLASLKRVSAGLNHFSEVLQLSPDDGALIYRNLEALVPGNAPVRPSPDDGVLTQEDILSINPSIKERVQKRFADADGVVQDEIVEIVAQLRIYAVLIASRQGKLVGKQEAAPDAKVTEAKCGFAHWHGKLDQLEQRITRRATMYEKRLPLFRAEIERFFGK